MSHIKRYNLAELRNEVRDEVFESICKSNPSMPRDQVADLVLPAIDKQFKIAAADISYTRAHRINFLGFLAIFPTLIACGLVGVHSKSAATLMIAAAAATSVVAYRSQQKTAKKNLELQNQYRDEESSLDPKGLGDEEIYKHARGYLLGLPIPIKKIAQGNKLAT